MSDKLYQVKLTLIIGEYEKTTEHIVQAVNAELAGYTALCDETHNEPLSFSEYDDGVEWEDDFMIYRVYSVTEIPQ
jgi:hypothetical protein